MTSFIQNDWTIFIFTIIGLCILSIGYIYYQKLSYNRFIAKLKQEYESEKNKIQNKQKEDQISVPDKPRDWFLETEYASYATFKSLPKVGEEKIIYFVRETAVHYIWSEQNYDYRSLWFHVKDKETHAQELVIQYNDSSYDSFSLKSQRKERFAYSKIMKWLLCETSQYFTFEHASGFDVVVRDRIKGVKFRKKQE